MLLLMTVRTPSAASSCSSAERVGERVDRRDGRRVVELHARRRGNRSCRAGRARRWRRSRSARCRRAHRRPAPARRRRCAARRGRRRHGRYRRSSRRRRRWCGCRSSAPAAGSRRSRCCARSVSAKRPVDDDADVGAGAADVEGDQLAPRRASRRPRRRRGRRRRAPTAASVTGFSATIAGVATPPFEAMIRKSPIEPGVAQRVFQTARRSRAPSVR